MVELLTEDWSGVDVSVAEIERELAVLRDASAGANRQPSQRTSVMTHVAWVPPEWLDAAERTLDGMAERHPSRTVILVPKPDEEGGIDAELSVRCFPVGDHTVCGEVIELHLRGDRALAPASLVLPLAITDLPVFLRWRGEPPFGETQWEQLVEVGRPPRRRLVRVARASLPRARRGLLEVGRLGHRLGANGRLADRARGSLARDPRAGDRDPRPAVPRRPSCAAGCRRGSIARSPGWSRRPTSPSASTARRCRRRGMPPLSPSDLLSAELDRFIRDRIYEQAVEASGS